MNALMNQVRKTIDGIRMRAGCAREVALWIVRSWRTRMKLNLIYLYLK